MGTTAFRGPQAGAGRPGLAFIGGLRSCLAVALAHDAAVLPFSVVDTASKISAALITPRA